MKKQYTLTPEDNKTIYKGARRVWISAPSIVAENEMFSIRITLMSVDGYPADCECELYIKNNKGINNLPEKISFAKARNGSILLTECSVTKEGFYSFDLTSKDAFISGTCNPIWVKKDPKYRLYWGDLHVHSVIGKCGTPFLPKSPDYGYRFAKDILGHDFCAMADHASALDDSDWNTLKKAVKKWHIPKKFIPILGFEGDYDGEDGGHFNLYFPTDDGEYKSFKQKFGGTLEKIFKFAKKNNALAISHHASRTKCGRDFEESRFGGQQIEPVMEVYSQWGSSEEYASSRPTIEGRHHKMSHYYRYAVKHGYKLGVIGGSDSHCTTPGGPVPMAYPQWGGKQLFPYHGGVAAVYAKELSRQGIFEAIKARRCYATSLEKILVWTECKGLPMGSEINSHKAEIEITVACTHGPLVEIVIVKDGEPVARFGQGGEQKGFESDKIFRLVWSDPNFSKESSYYVRATQFDGDMAWSSPIWIKPE